ncbi:MAG: FHA domain-containing protein [Patescibacteria group bacterium]
MSRAEADRPDESGYQEYPPATEAELAEGVRLDDEGRYVDLDDSVLELKADTATFRIAEGDEFGESVVVLTTPDYPDNQARMDRFHRIPSDHEVIIGRGVDNPGMILPETVSRYHFGVRRTDTGVNVRDLASKNGTTIRVIPRKELEKR